MITLIFQIFIWLLAAFLLGLLIGWLIHPLFCKKTTSHSKDTVDHNLSNQSGDQNITETNALGSSYTNSDGTDLNRSSIDTHVSADSSLDSDIGADFRYETGHDINKSDDLDNTKQPPQSTTKTTAATAAGIAAATALYATSNNDTEKSNDESLNTENEAKRLQETEEAEALKLANAKRLAEDKRLAIEAEAARIETEKAKADAEAIRIAAQKDEAAILTRKAQLLEEQALADKTQNDARIAAEIEAKKLADQQLENEIEADRLNLIAQQRLWDEAEAARLEAEKRLADEIEADRLKLIEEQRIFDSKADLARVAEEERIASEKAEAAKLAEEKHLTEEAETARLAEEERIASEKAEAAKLAEEKHTSETSKTESDNKIAAAAGVASLTAAAVASKDNATNEVVTDDMRPAPLPSPRDGKADDLKKIRGIGPVIEKTLNTEGIYHFQQIADFTPDNTRWVDTNISIPGRVDRDDWIGQAKALAAGQNYQGYAYDPESVEITDEMRPQKLASPSGQADDLKQIKGIGPVIEKTLNNEGIYHFKQIANFTPQNTMWIDKHISFPGRVHREDWIGQAKCLIDNREYKGHASMMGNESDDSDATIEITEDMRPARQSLKSNQHPDDLKVINGIGPVIEESLNNEGVYFYQQIADFTEENTRWVDNHMAFPGRIHREDWIGQAKKLVGKAGSTTSDAMKPKLLNKPLASGAEDLKRIKGIGKVLEKRLHKLGIYHYEQIAALSEDNIRWLTDFISFPEGRIESEDWVGQAELLAEGQRTEYSDRFDNGETPYK